MCGNVYCAILEDRRQPLMFVGDPGVSPLDTENNCMEGLTHFFSLPYRATSSLMDASVLSLPRANIIKHSQDHQSGVLL